MKLFSEVIVWKPNKQDTITTLFTKTELLAISQIAKEAINVSCLIIVLILFLLEILITKCNNIQRIRLQID